MKVDNIEYAPVQAQVLPWQQSVLNDLLQLKQQQRLPHALLIEMRCAVDSRSFGYYLVALLLCHTPRNNKPCGQCAACQAMQSNNYPDFSFTTLQENERTHKLNKDIKIDQIRQLIHKMSLTNSLQNGKFALIYPAEKLNDSSANALLKTLEEPSSESVLILLTHHAGRLPITIRSRCQSWVVENPAPEQAKQWLQDQGVAADQADQYLLFAQHDAQLAMQLFEQDFKQHYDRFSELLSKYQTDQIDVVTMVQSVKTLSAEMLRLILKNVLQQRIYKLLQKPLSSRNKSILQGMLEQIDTQQRLLSVEDNNLNLQLQLEDMLISLKQIIGNGSVQP